MMRHPILIVLHQEHSTPGRVGYALQERGYRARHAPAALRRSAAGDACTSTPAPIIFGGPMSANDSDDFIRREIDWIAVPLRDEQAVPRHLPRRADAGARMLGGRVFLASRRPRRDRLLSDPPDGSGPRRRRSLAGAGLPVAPRGFDLPGGAELLAEGDTFEVQAFRYGRAYALQFHPDVTHAMMHRWTTRGHVRMQMPGAKPRAAHFRRPRGL